MSGQTFLYDTKSKIVYTGTFAPTSTQTAHAQLGAKIGANGDQHRYVGGSIKGSITDNTYGFRSETFNAPHHGQCDMSGTSHASDITKKLNGRSTTNYIFK